MLSRIKVTLQIVLFAVIFQQSAYAHFINDEMNQMKELNISEKVKAETKPEIKTKAEKPAKIKAKPKPKPRLGYIDFIQDESLYDIMDQAEKANKAIFIDFSASWCGPCRIMEREVFSNRSVAHYMNEQFMNYKVDINTRTGNNVAYKYGVTLLPTLLIVTPQGDVIAKKTGLLDPEEFVAFAKAAVIR